MTPAIARKLLVCDSNHTRNVDAILVIMREIAL